MIVVLLFLPHRQYARCSQRLSWEQYGRTLAKNRVDDSPMCTKTIPRVPSIGHLAVRLKLRRPDQAEEKGLPLKQVAETCPPIQGTEVLGKGTVHKAPGPAAGGQAAPLLN